LSKRSGVPIPTIKYYLREGLLPPGDATAANQADYSDDHLRRLKLIRALIDVGGVSVAGARDVVAALADDTTPPIGLLGVAQNAIMPRRRPGRDTPEWAAARARVTALIDARGWLSDPDTPIMDTAADALAASVTLGITELADHLDGYADTASSLAASEVDIVLDRADPAGRMEAVVLGTVLGEALFGALRMLAHQHESARRLNAARPARDTGAAPVVPRA
jgi:DNA-binding transcriptional MerR regulator